jgi:uncharacterized protein (TIGR02646 family)
MKGITKNTEPEAFSEWKTKPKNSTYKKLQKAIKAIVCDSLIKEQGSLCAYCCCRILSENNSKDKFDGGNVLEHFIPQKGAGTLGASQQLNYQNFHMVCSGMKNKTHPKNEYCCDTAKGHGKDGKGEIYNPLLISPTEKDANENFVCEQAFEYNFRGQISAKSDSIYKERAKHTIDTLNLTTESLRKARENVYLGLFFTFSEEDDLDNPLNSIKIEFSAEEIQKLKQQWSQMGSDNKFKEYCNIILYFLNISSI